MLPDYIRQRLPLERLADELRRERFAHNRTVGRLKKTLKRLSVRDGTGHTSTRICLACQDVPLGLNPVTYRSGCPHNWLPDAIHEHERLEQRWDMFLRQLADGAMYTTPPKTDAAQESQAQG